jgi:hypothetical protein
MSSISRQLADGSGGSGGGYSLPGAIHAMTVDADGMLTYTRTLYQGSATETIGGNFNVPETFSDFSASTYSVLEGNPDDYDLVTGHKLQSTRFDQYYQGSADMYYYIDDSGNLCVRTNATYDYSAGPK